MMGQSLGERCGGGMGWRWPVVGRWKVCRDNSTVGDWLEDVEVVVMEWGIIPRRYEGSGR